MAGWRGAVAGFSGASSAPGQGAGFLARVDLALPPAQLGVPLVFEVYNAASDRVGDVVSPGELVMLKGAELAGAEAQAGAFPLPRSIDGVSVTIGGIVEPLLYAGPAQINFQAPTELPVGVTTLVVTRGNQASVARPIRVIDATPGIFTATSDGRTAPIVVHASDYSLVTAQNPAVGGEFLTLFCTGLGLTTPNIRAGDAAPAMPVPIRADLRIIGLGTVTYAGLAPGSAGVYQVNFQLRPDVAAVTTFIVLTMGNEMSNMVPLVVK